MEEEMTKKALVIGVGNVLMRDEGVGVRAVEHFQRAYLLPPGVACVDGGTAGIALLDYIKGFTHVIIVDAVTSGAPPSTIHRFNGRELEGAPPLRTTAHQIGIKELIAIAGFEGITPRIAVIGVVPEEVAPGIGLSPSVEAVLPQVAERIKDELKASGFEVN